MELTTIDFEQAAKIAAVVLDAVSKIEAITGKPADLRLHDTPPRKAIVTDDIVAKAIIKTVADEFKLRVDDMCGPSRKGTRPDARGIAMLAIKNNTKLSLREIGLHFNGRDHSTVLTRINGVQDIAIFDRQLSLKINQLMAKINTLLIYDEPRPNNAVA